MISNQEVAKNYIISNDQSYKMKDLVKLIYTIHQVPIVEKQHSFVEADTNQPVILMDSCFRNEITDIKGDNSALRSIGWEPTYSVEEILREMGN